MNWTFPPFLSHCVFPLYVLQFAQEVKPWVSADASF